MAQKRRFFCRSEWRSLPHVQEQNTYIHVETPSLELIKVPSPSRSIITSLNILYPSKDVMGIMCARKSFDVTAKHSFLSTILFLTVVAAHHSNTTVMHDVLRQGYRYHTMTCRSDPYYGMATHKGPYLEVGAGGHGCPKPLVPLACMVSSVRRILISHGW